MNGNGRGAEGDHGTDHMEITVTEPLDLTGVRKLGPVVDAVVARRPARLVIDMSACAHVDAAGIGLLLDTHRRMWRLGGALTLRDPSPRIRRLLQVARVDQVFHVVVESGPADAPGTPGTGTLPVASAAPVGVPPSATGVPVPPVRARATAPVRAR
ncbi:STAS domain-containing protein [Micromonospora sp. NPDC050187]|uniref:STAS domain-containing protein n=1 Tax=Micromonospora sp. NPDC050187 TaxID=3364277 RepID=UPI00378F4053